MSNQHQIFFLVWREYGGIPTYKHMTVESANAEAERLARQFSGCNFHVLECIGTVRNDCMKWTRIERIPF